MSALVVKGRLLCICDRYQITCTVKPALSGHSNIAKTNVFKTNGNLMKIESIAEAFCNTFDLHYAIIGHENQFLVVFVRGCLRQVSLY